MMAYPQFGYTACPTAASSLASSQLLSMSSGSTPATTVTTSCCETGRPIMTDPTTGQTVCSCQYSSATSLLSYPAAARSLSESVYNSYAAQGYVPFGADPSAFYSPLNPAYELKDGADAWRSLAHPTPCYPYDPTGMGGYPYGQSALAQRKNATREATSTLKAWLQEHIKNPYPTKGEKIMLAIITKMTLTQVSTWFANARRRLKKENKMTWSPRNRSDEDGNKLDSDEDEDEDKKDEEKKDGEKKDKDDDDIDINIDGGDELNICGDDDDEFGLKDADKLKNQCRLAGLPPHSPPMPVLSSSSASSAASTSSCMSTTADPSNPTKPRIWSLADVATSSSPSTGGLQQQPPIAPHQRGLHFGPPGSGGGPLRSPHGQLPPHLTAPHHPLSSTSPKSDSGSSFHPAVNGFRPWVNGASSFANGPGGPSSASTQPSSALLRPYPVAPRTEVH